MDNGRPLWAAYRALMMGSLIGLDKYPGVWPEGVGETWWRMLSKCVLVVIQGLRGVKWGTGFLAGGEGGSLAGFSVHLDRVGASALVDRIHGPA